MLDGDFGVFHHIADAESLPTEDECAVLSVGQCELCLATVVVRILVHGTVAEGQLDAIA